MKPTLKIGYCDYGRETNDGPFFFLDILKKHYNIVIDQENPDYLFYSAFGNKHHEYNCIKIYYTGENVVPNFNYCDYAIAFNYITFEDRYMRLPLWRLYTRDLENEAKRPHLSDRKALGRDFCARVVSNYKQTDGMREVFFDALSKYKKVASGGKYKNNVGGPVKDKQAFLQKYKFSLAFENTASVGYCTEKILQAFAANTVPIYYGDKTAAKDFNPKAFINVNDFKNIDEAIAYIKKIDQDDQAYLKMLREPMFKGGKMPARYADKEILAFLKNIFDQPLDEARRCSNVKLYADIDYVHMKKRDVYAALRAYAKRTVLKWFKK